MIKLKALKSTEALQAIETINATRQTVISTSAFVKREFELKDFNFMFELSSPLHTETEN
jgi:hypothetical protein